MNNIVSSLYVVYIAYILRLSHCF